MLEDKLTQKIAPIEMNVGRKAGIYFLALALGAIASCGTTGTTYSGVKSNQEPECNFSSGCLPGERCYLGQCVAEYKQDKGHSVCKPKK